MSALSRERDQAADRTIIGGYDGTLPWYRKHGKILDPITDEAFAEGMTTGHFAIEPHKAFPVLLFYSAVRKWEALRVLKEQFTITDKSLIFDVGPRLKKIRRTRKGQVLSDEEFAKVLSRRRAKITTPPLPLPIDAPFMEHLVKRIEAVEVGERLFPWSPATAYNIIDRAFAYPHLFRLSRITWFFLPHPEVGRPRGFSIPEVRTFTGLSVGALDYYIGLADVSDMGRAMYLKERDIGGNTVGT